MTNNSLNSKLTPPCRPRHARRRLQCGGLHSSLHTATLETGEGVASGPWENAADRGDLLGAVDESAGRLQRQIEQHRALVAAALRDCLDADSLEIVLAGCPRRSREHRYRTAIQQAIDVLEASRRAFKSKQLEALRKHLTEVLMDTG